jgi:Protein of unknown function (DUF2809)
VTRGAYLIAAIVLFAIETLIALFVHDDFVRPYLGDVLAIALVYTTLRAITPLGAMRALALTLAIALAIEIGQAFHIASALGLGENRIARVVLGGVFDWRDLIAYAAGGAIIAAIELSRRRHAQ